MKRQRSLFSQIVVTLFFFLIAFLLLYSYSNARSESIIKRQITETAMNHLAFFTNQLDSTVLQLETFTRILAQDPTIIEFQNLSFMNNYYERVKKKLTILEKIRLQSVSSVWTNEITVYAPQSGDSLSTFTGASLSVEKLEKLIDQNWNYMFYENNANHDAEFVHLSVEPYSKSASLSSANSIVEIRFTVRNIIRMLDQFKSDDQGDPFFYKPGFEPILNSSFNKLILSDVFRLLDKTTLNNIGHVTMKVDGISYLITYTGVYGLDGFIINTIPLQEILTPIHKNSLFFYSTIGLLLIISIVVAWVLYLNVQLPLRALIAGVQRLKMGDYNARVHLSVRNEFQTIIIRFNEMATQIQQLIENILEERIHSREAEIKQLQSQINPHFLYNSLSYIASMTKLDKKNAVLKMTYHLSDYFRYSTQVERQSVRLAEELKTANDYLSIHQMRMPRIQYVLEVEEGMLELQVPRLILQPIVENAIIYGIEPLEGEGKITVTGYRTQTENILVIEDNGGKMTESKLVELRKLLDHSPSNEDSVGCGMRNVHRRLQLQYGKSSGLRLTKSSSDGLQVFLHWKQGDEVNDKAPDRG